MRFLLALVCALFTTSAAAQTSDPGRLVYASRCAGCHGSTGGGGELGPSIVTRVPSRTDEELTTVIRQGLPTAGMPAATTITDTELADLIRFLRTLRPRQGSGPVRTTITLTNGSSLAGLILNHGDVDLQLLGDDRRIHLLRKTGDRYRAVTSQTDWPSYNGRTTGSRYSELTQINKSNVGRLAPRWMFSLPNTPTLQVTPVVVDGVMYVTSANQCYALDAGTGRQIWHYSRPRTKGLIGNAAGGVNRGVAVAGDRVFMVTDHAHIIALNRATGALIWETEMADWRQNYNATGAPLVVGNLVISGSAGGDEGVRGFLAAFDQATGKEVWRFWTVPAEGEPGSETWQGGGIAHPGAATWLTGTYDPELDTIYWPTGNPTPDLYGDNRRGDNLYSDSIIALDAKTGKLKWYFQFTPHDVWDYDAQETPALIDATWQGKPRKLLVQANRNGFFYVLDRTDGKFLLGKPFVKLNWALSELDSNGRPIQTPQPAGMPTWPGNQGATNWYSPSYSPRTGLLYVPAWENYASIFRRQKAEYAPGEFFGGGGFDGYVPVPGAPPVPGRLRGPINNWTEAAAHGAILALDIKTGERKWKFHMTDVIVAGILTTAGDVLFTGTRDGYFIVLDARTGALLWKMNGGGQIVSAPITYQVDGRQYVSVIAGMSLATFGLRE